MNSVIVKWIITEQLNDYIKTPWYQLFLNNISEVFVSDLDEQYYMDEQSKNDAMCVWWNRETYEMNANTVVKQTNTKAHNPFVLNYVVLYAFIIVHWHMLGVVSAENRLPTSPIKASEMLLRLSGDDSRGS